MCDAGASGTASSPCRCQRQEQWSRDREEARGPGTLGEVEGSPGHDYAGPQSVSTDGHFYAK